MTRPICVLSTAIQSNIQSNLALWKAIASFYRVRNNSVDASSYRSYVAGSLFIMGISLFSAVHMPGAIAHQHSSVAPPLIASDVHINLQRDIKSLSEQSEFIPPKDLGLPDRREPGGTR